jgi:hypothetical protein
MSWKTVLLLMCVMVMVSCSTTTVTDVDGNEIERNTFVDGVNATTNSVQAVEASLVCGTWTMKQVARQVVNIFNELPIVRDVPEPCPDPE